MILREVGIELEAAKGVINSLILTVVVWSAVLLLAWAIWRYYGG